MHLLIADCSRCLSPQNMHSLGEFVALFSSLDFQLTKPKNTNILYLLFQIQLTDFDEEGSVEACLHADAARIRQASNTTKQKTKKFPIFSMSTFAVEFQLKTVRIKRKNLLIQKKLDNKCSEYKKSCKTNFSTNVKEC